ncbi:MAG: hypothetical protein Q9185_002037 [Variospora sp. 1 TL-2023]
MSNNASLDIRAGYFALCLRHAKSEWNCSGNATSLVQRLQPDQDPANLIGHAASFKDDIVFYGLIVAAIVLLVVVIGILMTFPGWHEDSDDGGSAMDVKPFPSSSLSSTAALLSILASFLALLSMLWQHVASVTFVTDVENMTYRLVQGHVGAVGLALERVQSPARTAVVGITAYTGYVYGLNRFQVHFRTLLVAIGAPGGLSVLVRISFVQSRMNRRNAELRMTRRSAYEQTVILKATPKNTPTDVVLASSSLTYMLNKLAAKVRGMKKKANSVNLVTLSASAMPRLLSTSDMAVISDPYVIRLRS